MSMTEDDYYTRCEAEHDEPREGCISCEARALTVHCLNCGSEWVEGVRNSLVRAPRYGHGHETCEHVLEDDFRRELLCPVAPIWHQCGDMLCREKTLAKKCGDPITTPGAEACDFHQERINSVEAGRIYQRMVAAV